MGQQNLGKVRGQSAYDLWLSKPGNNGKTEEEFLQSLRGGINDIYETGVIDGTTYYKYHDGRLELYKTYYVSSECKNPFTIFFMCDVEQWIFPISFINIPAVNISCVGGVNFGFIINGNGTLNSEQIMYNVASESDMSGTGIKALVSLYAIGRWK